MRSVFVILILLSPLSSTGPAAQTEEADQPEHQIFELGDFPLESGVTLPDAKIAFATHGQLNAEGTNAILLVSSYSARLGEHDFLIGPENALDPGKYFLIATEMFASGGSSSPSNTPAPFDGPRFPLIAIRDNVEATYRLVTERFGITHLKAVIGFSMGAQQAFQWAVSHPDFMDLIVPYCGTAKTYPHGVVRLESAISIFRADAGFNDGDYDSLSMKTFVAWANHWAAWVFSQEWWRRELFKALGAETPEELVQTLTEWAVQGDPNNRISQALTWQRHNVGDTPGFGGDVERALRSIKARVLYMPCETDLYFPLGDAQYERQFIARVRFVPIPSLWGHAAGGDWNPEDNAFINAEIRKELR